MSTYFRLSVAAVFIVIFAAGACTTTGKNYYQISLPDAGPDASTPKEFGIIMVKPVEVDEIYNDFRLVYRYSPHQLNYYNYHFWIKKPEKMIREAITGYLVNRGAFKNVIAAFAEGDPELVLNAEVHVMEEYDHDKAWHAHLKMTITIVDYKTKGTVLVHSFDRAEPLPKTKVHFLPRVLSRILKEELNRLLTKLSAKKSNG